MTRKQVLEFAKKNKKTLALIGVTILTFSIIFGIFSFFELLCLSLLFYVSMSLLKIKSTAIETNLVLKQLDFKINKIQVSSKNIQDNLDNQNRLTFSKTKPLQNLLEQKSLFESLKNKFEQPEEKQNKPKKPNKKILSSLDTCLKEAQKQEHKELLDNRKKDIRTIEMEIQKLKETSQVIENQIAFKERKILSEEARSLKLGFNLLSIASWQEHLDKDENSSNELIKIIKFLADSAIFNERNKTKVLDKALRNYYRKEENISLFTNTIDYVLRESNLITAAYYACIKIIESNSSTPYAKYLYLLCHNNQELKPEQQERLSYILGKIKLEQLSIPKSCHIKTTHYKAEEKTLFYVLHNSEPYMSFGYASRSRGMITALQEEGYKIFGVTRLGFPHDRMTLKEKIPIQSQTPIEDHLDKITYLRMFPDDGKGLSQKPLDTYCEEAKKALTKLAYLKKPSVIIAASNFYTALPAILAARELKIPFIYEVRGLWEVTRYSHTPSWKDTHEYNFYKKMETKIALAADKVITLTQSMKDLIEERCDDKITVDIVPNAVNPKTATIFDDKDKELKEKFKIKEEDKVIGFIGSIVSYEGLNLLVDAATQLKEYNIKYLLVGTGAYLEELKNYTQLQKVEHLFIFTGKVPHSEVSRYYSLIDLIVLPRLSLPVCELVSPLKPFEAMAHKKLVLMSNVKAMKEFTLPGVNGFLFEKENLESLASQIKEILFSEVDHRKTRESSREWVLENRTWQGVSKKISSIIDQLQQET